MEAREGREQRHTGRWDPADDRKATRRVDPRKMRNSICGKGNIVREVGGVMCRRNKIDLGKEGRK